MQASHPATSHRVADFLRNFGPIIGMLAVLVIIAILRPPFLSPANIGNVLRQSSLLVLLSMGMTVVMSMRGVDLSIAQVADGAGVLAALLLLAGQPIWVAVLVPLAFGLGVGIVNGVLMAYLGIPAMIGTLGMMFLIRSGELIATNGGSAQILFTLPPQVTDALFFAARGAVGPVPMLVLIAAIVVLLVMVLMQGTAFGRRTRALGYNVRAAFLAGIDVRWVFGLGFVISGVLGAIAGILLVARTGTAAPGGAEPFLLDTFAATFLGTLASRRGEMTIGGTLIGALFIAFLGNGLTMLGLPAPYRYAFNGLFILLAMAVGALRQKN
jgi:ribose/xylose/arabinose/galactoside ABC-type transport system permease subunit